MTDVRKGDLLKFTHKERPTVTFTSRSFVDFKPGRLTYVSQTFGPIRLQEWDVEVVERPVDEELVGVVANAIWHASRQDEGTISATGANYVARAAVRAINKHGLGRGAR